MFLAFASLVAAVVPMFTYLILIWWLDRNDREPFWLVFLNFFWGATGAIFLGIIGSLIFQIPLNEVIQTYSSDNPAQLMDLSGAIITAPLVEEFTKGIFLFMMSYNKRFDGVVDGVVYGGAIGLGFGMTENFLYFVSYGNTPESWLYLVIIRTLFSAVLHCLSQATFGAFIGFAKFKSVPVKLLVIPLGFLSAVFIHFTWNLTVSFESTSILGFLFLIMYFIAFFAIFQIAVYYEGKKIKFELHEESQNGIIPAEHLNYLPFVTRRGKYGWCPQGVNQKDYVKTAITLAVRKDQYKNSKGMRKSDYEKEVALLRYNIQMMFYNASVNYYSKQQQ
jgi:RsiW-degrading membrane proteinase PrsW (M82 family)